MSAIGYPVGAQSLIHQDCYLQAQTSQIVIFVWTIQVRNVRSVLVLNVEVRTSLTYRLYVMSVMLPGIYSVSLHPLIQYLTWMNGKIINHTVIWRVYQLFAPSSFWLCLCNSGYIPLRAILIFFAYVIDSYTVSCFRWRYIYHYGWFLLLCIFLRRR